MVWGNKSLTDEPQIGETNKRKTMKTQTERNADATRVANELARVFALAEKLGVTITIDTDDGTHKASNPIASEDSIHNETGDAIVTICTDGQYDEGEISWGE